MMQFTHNIEVLHRLAVKHCPKTFIDENDYAVLYVQDVTTGTDYYIFSYDRWTCEFWVLTDPLRDMYFLDFEFIHIINYIIEKEIHMFSLLPLLKNAAKVNN